MLPRDAFARQTALLDDPSFFARVAAGLTDGVSGFLAGGE